jgi:uncharacterized protein (TIGR03435 family)
MPILNADSAGRLLLVALLPLSSAWAQAAASFEVASLKRASAGNGNSGLFAMSTDPALVRYSNITLANLIAVAYRTDERLIGGGPAWIGSELYDVAAKLPPETSKDRIPAMLQTLLVERFKLAVHRESKEQRVYFLVAGKDGPKLRPGREGGSQNQMLPGRIMGGSMPMSVLAAILARFVGDQVLDKTGLAETFEIDLKWKPEGTQPNDSELFAALQEQLGLKLEPGKAPVEKLIVDHVERIPAEN